MTNPQQPGQHGDFRVLFAAPRTGAGPAARTVLDCLSARGVPVTTISAWDGAQRACGTPQEPVGAAMLSWELFGSGAQLTAALDEIQRLSAPPPVVVVCEACEEQVVPSGGPARTAGWFWLHADSPHFVADQVEWLIRTYALRWQVLGALAAGAGGSLAAGG